MTLDEFEDALDQYGADLADWPEQTAAAARDLLANSPPAQQALALAIRLDGGLAELMSTPVGAPRGLADRILAQAAPAPHQADILTFPTRPAMQPAAAPAAPPSRFWHTDRAAMIAAAVLVVCFIGGVMTVYTVSPATAGYESIYISAIYSDLAR